MSSVPAELEELAARFVRRVNAPSSQEAYRAEVGRFLAWLPRELNADLLLDYRDRLRERGLAATTVRWRVTIVRAFLRYSQQRGLLDPSIELNIPLPTGQRGFSPRALTQPQLCKLLRSPDRRTWHGARDAAILACLGLGGLRASEVCGLNTTDVVSNRIEVQLTVKGKGGRVRLVSLPLPAAKVVVAWARKLNTFDGFEGELFGRAEGGVMRPLDAHAIRYIVRKHAKKAGLGSMSPHCLRHTEATLAIERGLPLHRVRARLGHASILTTAAYLHE